MGSLKSNFNIYNILNLNSMKVEFKKYTDKDDFLIMITPAIAFGKDSGEWSIGFCWLCFAINIDF